MIPRKVTPNVGCEEKMKSETTINLITDDPNNDEIVLYLVEESPWELPIEDRLRRIQDRIYNTVDVAIDGQLLTTHPETKGRKIRIQGTPTTIVNGDFVRGPISEKLLPPGAHKLGRLWNLNAQ